MKNTIFRRTRFLALPLLAVVWLACTSIPSWGQATTGQFVGEVTDNTGAVVPGAVITITDEERGVSFTGKTNAGGFYTVVSVPPGVYSVTASAPGFAEAKFAHASLVIDQSASLNFKLKVGDVSATVDVTDAPPILQTQSAEVGTVIGGATIVDLPLNGRNFYGLTTLVPGVVTYGQTNALNLSVNGQREFSNSVQLDGIESTTNRTQDITIVPNVDSVEEFKVITASYNAEFGNAAGGVLAIQTKAGTNHIHGDAFDFFRPNYLTARAPIPGVPGLQPASIYKQNNFGGTLGGPIKRDRAFAFVAFEGLRSKNAFTELDSTIPFSQINVLSTGAVDLSGLLDPGTGTTIPIFDPNVTIENCSNGTCPVAQQFPGNVIPASRVSQSGLNTLLNFFPKPNLPGTGFGWYQNYQVFSPLHDSNNKVDSRFDLVISSKDRLYAVYHWYDDNDLITPPYFGHTVVPNGGGGADQGNDELDGAQSLSLTYDHIFSPTALNEVRFGYLNYHQTQLNSLDGTDYSTKYGWGNIAEPGFPVTDSYPYVDLEDGYINGGSSYKPFQILDENLQFSDNFTWSGLKGHEMKFGADLRLLNSHPDFTIFPTGFLFYQGFGLANTSDPRFYNDNLTGTYIPGAFNYTGGSDIADLLLGLPQQADFGLQLSHPHTQSWNLDFYAQDSFRITPTLTFNYGLRYEFQDPWTEAHNDISNYDVATGNLLLAGLGGNSRALVQARKDELSPRFGFAKVLNPSLVVRFGGALFYSPENDGREDLLTSNVPFADKSSYVNSYANGPQTTNPASPFLYQDDLGIPRVTTISFPPNGSGILNPATVADAASITVDAVKPNIKTGTTGSFNLSMQQQLTKTISMDVAWVASISKHLSYKVGDINANPVTATDGLINPALGQIQFLSDEGLSKFNSLQVKVTKQASRNLSFLASYTWGHSLDNGPAPFDTGLNNDNPQNPNNLKPEYASSDSDVRQNFVLSGSYNLPFGHGQVIGSHTNRVLNGIIGGWRYSPIVTLRTGTPVNVITGLDPAGSFPGLRPNVTGNPNLPRKQRTVGHYFNTAAFSDPTPAPGAGITLGDAGRNIVSGPGFTSLDSSLAKDFGIFTKYTLQFRIEAFNTFNSEHFSNPDGNKNDGTFGVITTDGASRNVQLAAKFLF